MASGDTMAVWDALAARAPSANHPTLDLRNGHVVLDFDDTTDETTYFFGVLPAHYAGGSFTAQVEWMATTATSGDVDWKAAFERHSSSVDLDSDSFGTDGTATQPTAATSGAVSTVSISVSPATTPSAGESFRLRISRNASADNMAGDAELLSIELREA
jgi:hypothetical protein